jgi:hypothetical protein
MNKFNQAFVQKLLDQCDHIGLAARRIDIIFAGDAIADFPDRDRLAELIPNKSRDPLHPVIDAVLQIHDDDFTAEFAGYLSPRKHHTRRQDNRSVIGHKVIPAPFR